MEVSDLIENYCPRWTPADVAVWDDSLATAAREWVRYVCPGTPDVASTLLSYTSQFCLWHFQTYGNIDADQLWSIRNINYFTQVHMGHKPATWQGNAEQRLRSIGPFANPRGTWALGTVERSRNDRLVGYTPDEEQAYIDAAFAYHRAPRRYVLFVVAASFGGGLTGGEIVRVTHDDVIFDDGAWIRVVNTDGTERVLPVRHAYHEMLFESVSTCFDTTLIGPHSKLRNGVSNLAKRAKVTGLEPLRTYRMRATWHERHIANGTPIPMLLDLSGNSSANMIVRAALQVPLVDRDAALTIARLA